MSSIGEIDRNLAIKDTVSGKDFIFKNALCSPFKVYGLLKDKPFTRIPTETAETVNSGVAWLNFNTSGGRVRFKTNSLEIAIRAKMPAKCLMPHMAFTGSSGFDMYIYENGVYSYAGSFIPPTDRGDVFESVITLPDSTMRDITINFPLYDGVDELLIGLSPESELIEGSNYLDIPPVIYYGSSITQGGCASRPGNSYQAMISRHFNIDYRNFGWSGSARGEQAMANYIAAQPMSLFFLDYDHNAPNAEELEKTHEQFFMTIREKNPDIPIIMATKTDIPRSKAAQEDTAKRRAVVYTTYQNAIKRGDKNVRFIDGGNVFKSTSILDVSPDSCTVDGCHPNDLGFACMAKVFGDAISDILKL